MTEVDCVGKFEEFVGDLHFLVVRVGRSCRGVLGDLLRGGNGVPRL